jgi:hypothetical protein
MFGVGVLMGTVLLGLAVWGDLEASMFDSSSIRADAKLKSLNCPVMITTGEIGKVSASLTNTHVRSVERRLRVHVSDGFAILMREVLSEVPIEPGKTQKLNWTVTPEDAAYGKIILVKVFMHRKYPLSSESGSCGIFVVDLPQFTGKQIVIFTTLTSLLTMVVGASVWTFNNKPIIGEKEHNIVRLFLLLGMAVIGGIIIGFLGWWVLGVAVVAVIFLMIISIPSTILFR